MCCTLFMIIMTIVNRKSAIDIQMYDTYFVIASIHINALLACYALFCAFIYKKMKGKKVIHWMIWFHILATTLILYFYLFGFKIDKSVSANYHYIATSGDLIKPMLIMSIFIVANVFFSYNFIRSRTSSGKDA